MSREATIKQRLEEKGFKLEDSPYLGGCKTVTGPNGEIYGPMTANECAARFLDGEELAPQQAHSTPARSASPQKPTDPPTDVNESVARDAEHARRSQPSLEK